MKALRNIHRNAYTKVKRFQIILGALGDKTKY
jgi:hypothetical protein